MQHSFVLDGFFACRRHAFSDSFSLCASGGPLFPAAFSFYASGGILFVNSDKKYAKSAARDQWSLDSLYLQELPFVMGRSGN